MSDREKFDLLAEGLALNYAAANSLPTYPHDLAKNIADAIERAVAEDRILREPVTTPVKGQTAAQCNETTPDEPGPCISVSKSLTLAESNMLYYKEHRDALVAEIDRLKEACSKEHESVQELDAENQRLKAELERVTSERNDWQACADCYRKERDALQAQLEEACNQIRDFLRSAFPHRYGEHPDIFRALENANAFLAKVNQMNEKEAGHIKV